MMIMTASTVSRGRLSRYLCIWCSRKGVDQLLMRRQLNRNSTPIFTASQTLFTCLFSQRHICSNAWRTPSLANEPINRDDHRSEPLRVVLQPFFQRRTCCCCQMVETSPDDDQGKPSSKGAMLSWQKLQCHSSMRQSSFTPPTLV